MKRTLALIEQVLEEHKTIFERLDQVANDAEALHNIEEAKEAFMPGRFDQKRGLEKLKDVVNLVDEGLQAHFNREETAMLAAFEEQEDQELSSAFHSLILEHEDLRNRLASTKDHIYKLTNGDLSRHHWDASAYDMRAHLSHTRKLLEAHAEVEQELMRLLRHRMLEQKKE
jgi:hypothetical protein